MSVEFSRVFMHLRPSKLLVTMRKATEIELVNVR